MLAAIPLFGSVLSENVDIVSLMPRMKVAAFRSVFDALKGAISKGEFTGADVIALRTAPVVPSSR